METRAATHLSADTTNLFDRMLGDKYKGNDRAVSEIYGTVLIISLSFFMAVMLIGVGYYVIDGTTSETEDSLSQDSMDVMNERITEVTGSSVETAAEFDIPGVAADADADPDAGEVAITVEPSNFDDPDLLNVTDLEYTDTISLGSVTQVGQDGDMSVWQGGGLWYHDEGTTSVTNPPELNYDGTSLNLGFTNLTEAGDVSAGDTVTVSGDRDASVELSEDLQDAMRDFWTIQPGDEVLGTDEVDVTLEIESELADGWANYAEEGLDAELDEDYIVEYDGDDVATITFKNVGTPIEPSLTAEFEETAAGTVIYGGPAVQAPLNDVIDSEGDGAFSLDTDAADDHPEIDNSEYYIGVNYGEEKAAPALAVTEYGEDDWENWDEAVDDVDSDVEPLIEDYENGEYTFDESAYVCVFRGDEVQDDDFKELYKDCFGEVPNIALENTDGSALNVTDLAVDEDEIKVDQEVEVTATVENDGFEKPEGENLTLKVKQEDGIVTDSYTVVSSTEADSDHSPGEEVEYDLTWEPSDSEHRQLVDEIGDETEVAVDTGADTDSATVDVAPKQDPDFNVSDVSQTYDFDEDMLTVEANITNEGYVEDTQTVTLRATEGSDTYTLTTEEVGELDDGESDSIELVYETSDDIEEIAPSYFLEVTTAEDVYEIGSADGPNLEIDISEDQYIIDDAEDDADAFEVEFDVENTGDVGAEQWHGIEYEDNTYDPEPAEVAAGETETFTREIGISDVDADNSMAQVEVTNDDSADDVTVRHQVREFEVDLDLDSVYNAENDQITYTVENVGETEGSDTVELDVDGDTMTEEVTLDAGEEETLTYELERDDADSSDVTVEAETSDDSDSDTTTITATPVLNDWNWDGEGEWNGGWISGYDFDLYFTTEVIDLDDPAEEVNEVTYSVECDVSDWGTETTTTGADGQTDAFWNNDGSSSDDDEPECSVTISFDTDVDFQTTDTISRNVGGSCFIGLC